jgi:hypothetical protein
VTTPRLRSVPNVSFTLYFLASAKKFSTLFRTSRCLAFCDSLRPRYVDREHEILGRGPDALADRILQCFFINHVSMFNHLDSGIDGAADSLTGVGVSSNGRVPIRRNVGFGCDGTIFGRPSE